MDSNFLMIPFQFGVDIFQESKRILDVKYEIFVPECVIEELKRLSKRKTYAKAALQLARNLKLMKCSCKNVDEFLYKMASKTVIICTNDKNLKEKIRKKGSPVIYLRQRKYLDIDGCIK